jgi:hypothetical protein
VRKINWSIIAFALIVFTASLWLLPEGGVDFRNDIRPATHNLNAPWLEGLPLPPYAAVLLWPVGIPAAQVGTALMNGVSVLAVAAVLRKYRAPEWTAFPILISPVGYYMWLCGQTDWLVLSGLLFWGGFDIFLFTFKPQMAFVVAITRAKMRPLSTLWPILAVLLSFVIWGWWPGEILKFQAMLVGGNWNSSLFPWSIPIGIILASLSVWSRSSLLGIVASPLLFPYVNMGSYLGILTVIAIKSPVMIAGVWILTLIVGFGAILL